MMYALFKQVVLARDIPEDGLKKGDLATVVDHHPVRGGEDGYSLEVFNALGETVIVTVVPHNRLGSADFTHSWIAT